MIDDVGLIRKPQLEELVGSSYSTIRRLMLRGEFPRPVQIGPRAVGWRAGAVKAWLASRPEAKLPPPHSGGISP